MNNLRKGLALFLVAVMMFSSLSATGFALTEETFYTVETYMMDVLGKYPSEPSQTAEYSAVAGETVVFNAEEKEGFTLDSSKSISEFVVNADGSSTGKIYYSRNKYKATYVYEDLLGAQTEESVVYYDAPIPDFEANPSGKPAKQGYNFIMWSLDANNKIPVPSKMPAEDINMYPIYEIKTYTYTFDAGENAAFSNGKQTLVYEYNYGDIPVLPDEKPVRPHMEFIDWDKNLPKTVSSNLTFNALYNELTYSAIFMDGEDEVGYLDGYYYADLIEVEDIPGGYEAWTLSDGTYAKFPYTVTGNHIFFAAEAPKYYTVRFYLDINDAEAYEEFTVLQGDEIDFPADPEKEGYTFSGWNSDITVMPAEDIDFIAEWNANKYTVTFDTKGGNEISPVTIEFGKTIELPVNPTKNGYVFAGWDGIPDDGNMPSKDITLIAKWERTVPEDLLSFKTQLYTFDEASKDWVIADKVERGEKVKARIFIETGFAVGEGQMLCFFNQDVFEMENVSGVTLAINSSPTSSAKIHGATGTFATPPKTHSTFEDLVTFGYISEEFLNKHTPVTFTFRFSSFKCHSISGDEWFAEFDLTAKEDAVGTGDFFVVPETIINSEEGYYAYITLSKGVEGGSSLSAEGMLSWKPSTSVESSPVSTGYGRITLNADGGKFMSNNEETFVFDNKAGEPVVIEIPTKEGYDFNGWDYIIPEIMPEDSLIFNATWTPCKNTAFKVIVHYYNFSGAESVYTDKTFEYSGMTGNAIEIVEEIPSSPDENTIYIALNDFNFEHNKFDTEAQNVLNAFISPDGTATLELYFIPVSYVVIFDSNDGKFADGDSVKYFEIPHGSLAVDYQPYSELLKTGYTFNGWYGMNESTIITSDITFVADWKAKEYDAIFDANGGIYADGCSQKIYSFAYESTVNAPAENPVKEDYELIGWKDENGTLYSADNLGLMRLDGIKFYAEWKETIKFFNATFDDGISLKTFMHQKGEKIILPAPDEREGFEFDGWYTDGVRYEPGSEFIMPANNVKFTCNWIEIPVETTTEPTTTQPETEPTTTEPAATDPTTTVPVTETTTVKPTVAPTTTNPVTVPTTSKPTTTKPITTVKPTVNTTTSKPTTTDAITEPSTTKPVTTKPTTVTTTVITTKPVVTEPSTVPTTVHAHSPKTIVVNAACEKSGERYQICNECGEKIGNTTIIPALGHSAGEWQTIIAPTYEKEGKKVKKCLRNGCGIVLEEATVPVLEPETVDFSIKTPSRTTIDYGDSIILRAVVDLPAGAKVVWEANNSNFSYSPSNDGKTCLISPASNGETIFTAKVVDSKGNAISEVCTQKMNSKAGFFQKIIAFFKKLFGMTKVYPEFVTTIYDK